MPMEGRLVWATSDCKHWQEPTYSRGCRSCLSLLAPLVAPHMSWILWLHWYCQYSWHHTGGPSSSCSSSQSVRSWYGDQKKTLDSIIYCCSYSCIICAVRLSSFLKAGSVSLVRKATGTAAMTNDPCTVIKTFHSNANLATITQTVMSPLFLSYF